MATNAAQDADDRTVDEVAFDNDEDRFGAQDADLDPIDETPTHVEVTYGHTLSDRPNDYIPGMDGWRPGALQELISLALDVEAGTTPEAIAEAIYEATNAPRGVWSPLAHAVEAELARHRAAGTRTWVMDVGDTVVVAGVEAQPVLVECASVGFTRRPLSDLHVA